MRPTALLVATLALGSAGCSAFVAASGTNLSKFTDRTQVHETFGPPILVTETPDGGSVETFTSRRKFHDATKGIGIVMIDTLTLGLAELYLFPHEVVVASWRSVVGQRLDVQYDDVGRVVRIRRDGEPVYGTDHERAKPHAAPPPPYLPGSATAATTTGTARFAPKGRRRGGD